jgi:hypothetical protein
MYYHRNNVTLQEYLPIFKNIPKSASGKQVFPSYNIVSIKSPKDFTEVFEAITKFFNENLNFSSFMYLKIFLDNINIQISHLKLKSVAARQKAMIELSKQIHVWNGRLSKQMTTNIKNSNYFEKELLGFLPFFNTKPRKIQGLINSGPNPVKPGHDDLYIHDEDDVQSDMAAQRVLCSHISGKANHGCFVTTLGSLIQWFMHKIHEKSVWVCVDSNYNTNLHLVNTNKYRQILGILCPMNKTKFCKNKDGTKCNNLIPLTKILTLLPKKFKKSPHSFFLEMYRDDPLQYFMDIEPHVQNAKDYAKDFKAYLNNRYGEKPKRYFIDQYIKISDEVLFRTFPDKYMYCPKNGCEFSAKPFRISVMKGNYNCTHCKTHHDIHGHRQICECSTTFCAVCKKSPYHEMEVCQGPVEDLGENAEYLLEHTRPCPHCRVRTEKTEGCDHMVCGSCQNHWCWRCLQPLIANNPYNHTCPSGEIIQGNPDGHYHDIDQPAIYIANQNANYYHPNDSDDDD